MELANGDNGMEKLLEGETKVDDPRSMRNIRKESRRRRVQGMLDLMRRASHVNVVHRDLEGHGGDCWLSDCPAF